MLDDLKEEGIVQKVGGRFKLSTLIQKRMVALNTGARPLVEARGGDKLSIVLQEIIQDRIYLDLEGNLKTRPPEEEFAADGQPFDGTASVEE
jgi:DNA-directed RNA polymerase subunit omega